MLVVPAFVTWTFAEHESESFSGDWVLIEEFYGESGENIKAGSTPGDESVATFLRSYIAP